MRLPRHPILNPMSKVSTSPSPNTKMGDLSMIAKPLRLASVAETFEPCLSYLHDNLIRNQRACINILARSWGRGGWHLHGFHVTAVVPVAVTPRTSTTVPRGQVRRG